MKKAHSALNPDEGAGTFGPWLQGKKDRWEPNTECRRGGEGDCFRVGGKSLINTVVNKIHSDYTRHERAVPRMGGNGETSELEN